MSDVVERGELVPVAEVEADLSTLTLDELATVVRDGHSAVLASGERIRAEVERGFLPHAIHVGDALIVAKQVVAPGEWNRWLESSAQVSVNQCQAYMRVAHYKAHLVPNTVYSLSAALQQLKGLPTFETGQRFKDELRAEAHRLRDAGLGYTDIGRAMGISRVRAQTLIDPVFAEKQKKSHAKSKAKRMGRLSALQRFEAEQERRAERDLLAKTGTENQRAIWNHIRQASVRAGQEHLTDLTRILAKAEDEILAVIDRSEHGS